MKQNGSEFYDQEQNFKKYLERRNWNENANDTIEKPIFMELFFVIKDKRILDLGCGTASYANELIELGAHSYTGIEGSINMVEESEKHLHHPNASVIHSSIEEWKYPELCFDTVISRLAIHYLSDVDDIFNKVYRTLRHGGEFIFSVEHPVMTSSFGLAKTDGYKQDWTVDQYFHTGIREQAWLEGKAIKYHRTIEDYFGSLQKAGFVIESLRESKPRKGNFQKLETFERRMRIPLFLFLKAKKA